MMIFGRKNKNIKKCEDCGNKVEDKFSFCPHCGNSFIDLKQEKEDYGLLGRNDDIDLRELDNGFGNLGSFGITDKLVSSMFNAVMKSMDKQMRTQMDEAEKIEKNKKNSGNAEIRTFPNGISIRISGPMPFGQVPLPQQRVQRRKKVEEKISEELINRMSSLPREKAKSSMKRLGDKVVYELVTPGVVSVDDVFVTKTESGYEIKAVGDEKVYTSNVSIDLPLRKYTIFKNKILFEFMTVGEIAE